MYQWLYTVVAKQRELVYKSQQLLQRLPQRLQLVRLKLTTVACKCQIYSSCLSKTSSVADVLTENIENHITSGHGNEINLNSPCLATHLHFWLHTQWLLHSTLNLHAFQWEVHFASFVRVISFSVMHYKALVQTTTIIRSSIHLVVMQ